MCYILRVYGACVQQIASTVCSCYYIHIVNILGRTIDLSIIREESLGYMPSQNHPFHSSVLEFLIRYCYKISLFPILYAKD